MEPTFGSAYLDAMTVPEYGCCSDVVRQVLDDNPKWWAGDFGIPTTP